ncbi:MAG: GntR family transcriptional regulator [Firmicutes bacterium]|nr:GntR family transcriptional regulator [Bacillota bacterium]
MEWKIDDSRPIWPQIKEQLMRDIVAGKYPMGSPFPTVRDLAEDAKVNRNTMQRALSELENEGLVITNRTSGRTVTMDENLIKLTRGKIAKEKIVSFRQEMEDMGFTMEEIISLMRGSDSDVEKGE